MESEEFIKKCGALALALLLFYASYAWIREAPLERARDAKTSHWIPAIATVTGKRIAHQYVPEIGDENILVLNYSWSVGTQTISIEYGQIRSTNIDDVNRFSAERPLGCELAIKVDPANLRRFIFVEFEALEGHGVTLTYMMGILYFVLGLYFLIVVLRKKSNY
ncbi:MAG: hypothetical protein A2W80_04665 [Candidatus Riflebacteria bacterium GWC2_50_8]|nr:MAG: hypothetical protein A2W80_04665 [Candidatus Riflebacteria bacterium GWC2_50_8]